MKNFVNKYTLIHKVGLHTRYKYISRLFFWKRLRMTLQKRLFRSVLWKYLALEVLVEVGLLLNEIHLSHILQFRKYILFCCLVVWIVLWLLICINNVKFAYMLIKGKEGKGFPSNRMYIMAWIHSWGWMG